MPTFSRYTQSHVESTDRLGWNGVDHAVYVLNEYIQYDSKGRIVPFSQFKSTYIAKKHTCSDDLESYVIPAPVLPVNGNGNSIRELYIHLKRVLPAETYSVAVLLGGEF